MATEIVSAPDALLRPLVAAALFGVVALALFLLALRSWPLAAIFASGFVLFTVRQPVPGLILLILGSWWLIVLSLRRRQGRQEPSWRLPRFVARAVGIFSIVLVGVASWTLLAAYSEGRPSWEVPSYRATGDGGPNVYILLVDGYPREDTLREKFEIDNEPFLQQLDAIGLTTSPRAQANYNKTWLTLASMFNGDYIDRMVDLTAPIPESTSLQIRWLTGMIQRASLLDVFRERGYTIRTIPSPFSSTALTTADHSTDVGGLSELEVRLISYSPWSQVFRVPVLEMLKSTHKDAIHRSLELTVETAESASDGGPQLVFTHVQSPHAPFVLHPEGTDAVPDPACMPTLCAFWNATMEEVGIGLGQFRDGLDLQIRELNRLLIDATSRIVRADPEAVIILMSDHGIRYSLSDLPEHYRILFAARVPGSASLFPQDESPVNVLRRVLAHLGEDIDALPYEGWGSGWSRYLELERIDAVNDAS